MQSHEATDLRTEVGALAQAVDDGRLWIDGVVVAGDVHERCARRYESLADQIDQQIRTVGVAASLPGFGGFGSGAALRHGFEGKATDAIELLREYSSAARQLAQAMRAAAGAYAQHDADAAAAIAATVPQPVEVGHA